MEPPASPTLLYIGDRWRVRRNRFQWKVGPSVETEEGWEAEKGRQHCTWHGPGSLAPSLALGHSVPPPSCGGCVPKAHRARLEEGEETLNPVSDSPGEPLDSAGVGDVPPKPEHPDMMFELLWPGLRLDPVGQFHLLDEELASTRPGRRLTLFLQRWVPRSLARTEQQLRQWHQEAPLSPAHFQQLLLTSLACVYRLHAALEGEEKGHWARLFATSGQEILQDLCKGHCPPGQTPTLSPWASLNGPFQQH
ncbi:protein FAM180B [Monodelphis domestica]|uniref:protein FAM180B n=1 Tax=Monodelphis domestica TaxID=13616 RepID=UPI0024E1C966|nr:protein FAM180B [Monodelphis domestica]